MNTDLTNKRVLRLTLKKQWFDLMVTGEKNVEYRKHGNWILSRLEREEPGYDYILFTNGYGADKPWFLCKYEGWGVADCAHRRTYGGHEIFIERYTVKIYLGPVIESGNLKP